MLRLVDGPTLATNFAFFLKMHRSDKKTVLNLPKPAQNLFQTKNYQLKFLSH